LLSFPFDVMVLLCVYDNGANVVGFIASNTGDNMENKVAL